MTTEITPDQATAALPELEKLANELRKNTGVPGLAIAVVYHDQVVYAKGCGRGHRVSTRFDVQAAGLDRDRGARR
ncbi:MAG: serine hydrolase [Nitrospira sp.]|nr:serine hydrolase [Nitrospira sp.]